MTDPELLCGGWAWSFLFHRGLHEKKRLIKGFFMLVVVGNEMIKNSALLLLKICLNRDYGGLVTIKIKALKDLQIVTFAIDV